MTDLAPGELADRLQRLLTECQHHADALERINSVLAQVGSALDGFNGTTIRRGPGRPRKTGTVLPDAPKRWGRRGSYATTADEMILAFVRERRGATTQEIKAAWKTEGRGGTADNALSKMVRERKLKRSALAGRRGSRYTAG